MGCVSSANTDIILQDKQTELERRDHQNLHNVVTENVNRDIRQFYEVDKTTILGTGISGSVRICVHHETKTQYALKCLDKRKIKKEKLNQLKEEIKIMKDLDHPNILRLHEYFETDDCIYLILELCRGGELLDRLHSQKDQHYHERVACRYLYTMTAAVRYCHDHLIVHRDLKLENFLFENDSPISELKLIDFGLSQHFVPNEKLHKAVGTPYYVSPEVLTGQYDAKCDVWSLGVIAYMLLSGSPPFYGDSDHDTLLSVKNGAWKFDPSLFRGVSTAAKDFIKQCLTRDPEQRPSSSQLMEHTWFKQLHDNCPDTPISKDVISRLKGFKKKSLLAKLCMEVVAHTLQSSQIDDLRKEFLKFDVHKRGEISLADLKTVLEKHGSITQEDLVHVFSGVDLDHTGIICYHEFIAATLSRKRITEGNMKIAFDKLSHHHEFITGTDIQDFLGADNVPNQIESIFADADLVPDAKIDFDQFKVIMMGGQASPMVRSPYNVHRKRFVFFNKEEDDRDTSDGVGEGGSLALRPAAVHIRPPNTAAIMSPIRSKTSGKQAQLQAMSTPTPTLVQSLTDVLSPADLRPAAKRKSSQKRT